MLLHSNNNVGMDMMSNTSWRTVPLRVTCRWKASHLWPHPTSPTTMSWVILMGEGAKKKSQNVQPPPSRQEKRAASETRRQGRIVLEDVGSTAPRARGRSVEECVAVHLLLFVSGIFPRVGNPDKQPGCFTKLKVEDEFSRNTWYWKGD